MTTTSAPGNKADETGRWSNATLKIYGAQKPTKLPNQIHELEALAKGVLPSDNYNYAGFSAGAGETARSNLSAFHDYQIIPRMLVNSNKRDLSIELFGSVYPSPILIAPIGVLSLFHKDAEEAVAAAGQKLEIPYIMSTAATRSIETAAKANGNGSRWYQLYWPVSKSITESLLTRAKSSGFTTLVVTLDTTLLGYRPKDLDTAHLPFLHGQGCAVGFSDPVFCEREGIDWRDGKTVLDVGSKEEIKKASMKWLGEVNSGVFREWKDLQHIRDFWKGPIVLKGIQSIEDAHLAIEMKIDGIIVSNHGGRQVDGAISSLSALALIASDAKVKESKMKLLFDSGVRTGSDVVKIMALGADAVLIGRPWVWGLSLDGQAGVEHVLTNILSEAEITMGLMGCPTIHSLQNTNCLRKVERR